MKKLVITSNEQSYSASTSYQERTKFVTLSVVAVQHVCVYGDKNVMLPKLLFALQVAVISSATLCVPLG